MTVTADIAPTGAWVLRRLLCLVATALGFTAVLVVAMVVGSLPVPAGDASGEKTVRIGVFSNGFHSDIVLPADGTALEALGVSPADFPVDINAVEWWAIGWGSWTAYTSLRAVSDLTPGIFARSIAFDETVMHVAPIPEIDATLGPADGVWFLDLHATQYARLLERMAVSFTSDRRPIPDLTQGFGDRYYDASGRFTAWFNCNAWVGRQLREAAVPVGLWTPTAQTLAYGLNRVGGSQE